MSAQPRIAIVLNQGAKSVNSKVIETLASYVSPEDLFVSTRIEDAPQIAERVVRQGFDAVLTGGGDGTFTVMATEITRFAVELDLPLPQFGLLKLGTGNALACVVRPLAVPKKGKKFPLFEAYRGAETKRIHLVSVEGTLTPFAGLGADAKILSDYNATKVLLAGTPLAPLGTGLTGYGIAASFLSLPALVFKKMPRIRIINEGGDAWPVDPKGCHTTKKIENGATLYEGPSRMAALSTIPYYGFGMKLFPFADAHTGFMNLRVSTLGSLRALTNVRAVWNGSYHDSRVLSDFMVQSIRIESDSPIDFQIGGDMQGKRRTISAQVSRTPYTLLNFPVLDE